MEHKAEDLRQLSNQVVSLENFKVEQYNDIELTAKEKNDAIHTERYRIKTANLSEDQEIEALRRGRMKKFGDMKTLKYFESISKEPETVKYTTEQFLNYVKNRLLQDNKPFEIDKWNSSVITTLAEYFTDNPDFERRGDGFSLKKGLILFGNVGCGKTYIMNAFNLNPKLSFGVFSARAINIEFAQFGWVVSKKYSSLFTRTFPAFGQTKIGLCIDDLGTEENKKHFGDSASVINDIIENRYFNRDEVPFYATHITMNLTSDEIELFYGTRLKDRMREAYNVITFNPDAPSRRK